MTLLHTDGFDYATALADVFMKYSSMNNQNMALSTVKGRLSTSCLVYLDARDYVQRSITEVATAIAGGAFYCAAWASSHNPFRFLDTAGILHVYLDASGGFLRVVRGDGTVLGTGTTSLTNSVYYYLEMKATIADGTGGSVAVRINGVTELNLTGIDTRNGGTAGVGLVRFGNGTGGANAELRVEDLYIANTLGTLNNDFLGDVRVQTILPSGNGATSNLVGSDANSVDNYLLVDEAAPSTADYVESSTVGDKDTYAMGDVGPTTGSVLGVSILPYAAKTDAGVRSIATVARLAAVEEDSASLTLSTTYTYYPNIRETKPGGGAWSIADINSTEFGVKVTA